MTLKAWSICLLVAGLAVSAYSFGESQSLVNYCTDVHPEYFERTDPNYDPLAGMREISPTTRPSNTQEPLWRHIVNTPEALLKRSN